MRAWLLGRLAPEHGLVGFGPRVLYRASIVLYIYICIYIVESFSSHNLRFWYKKILSKPGNGK